jgi:SHS2 domain-containing protein
MKDYEIIEHTADIGIIVSAKNLRELFIKTAEAMFDIIAEPKGSIADAKSRSIEVSVNASDTKELFVAWLSELLSLSDCKNIIFTEFDIDEITDTALKETATGIDIKFFKGKSEIKAVTYHELKVEESGGQFKAQVIFDV